MNDPFAVVSQLLSDVVLPNLKVVQASQGEQIASNDRIEHAIEELRAHLEQQFGLLSAQLTACRAEIAALQAALKAAQAQGVARIGENKQLVH